MISVLVGLAALPALSPAAFAIEIFDPAISSTLGRQTSDAELRILRNQIQRQQFQQQQQQNRQQDRQIVPMQPRIPEVPIMKPTCQTSIYGSRLTTPCR